MYEVLRVKLLAKAIAEEDNFIISSKISTAEGQTGFLKELQLVGDDLITPLSATLLGGFCRRGNSSEEPRLLPPFPEIAKLASGPSCPTVSNVPVMPGATSLVSSDASSDCCHLLASKSSKFMEDFPGRKSNYLLERRWCSPDGP